MAGSGSRWPHRLGGLLVALALLALAEVVLRLAGWPPPEPGARFINEEAARAHAGFDYVPDPELFWRLPASRAIVGGGYRTNALGLRGPEIERPKPAGTTRIALIGDSCAFGLGLDLTDTVGALLETLRGPRGTRVETIRLAVPGYSSQQSLGLARRFFDRLQVDESVLWVGAFNDAAPACGASDARIAAGERSSTRAVLRRSALFRAIGRLVRPSAPDCPPTDPGAPPRVSLAELQDHLTALERLAGRGGRKVVVLVPPVVRGARAVPYAQAIARRPGAIDPALGSDGFQADRIHPNRSGSLAIARALAPALGLRGDIAPSRESLARRADTGERALGQGDAATALEALEAIEPLELADRPRLLAARITALEALGRWDEARARLDPALAAHPESTELHRLRAEALAEVGDDRGAMRELRRTLQQDRGWLAGYLALARILDSQGDREGARRQVDAGLALAPDSPELVRMAQRLAADR